MRGRTIRIDQTDINTDKHLLDNIVKGGGIDRVATWRVIMQARIDPKVANWIEKEKRGRTKSEFINELLTWAYQTYEKKK